MLGVKQATPVSVRLGLTQNWKYDASPLYYNHQFFTQLNLAHIFHYKNRIKNKGTSLSFREHFSIMDIEPVLTSKLNLLIFYYPSTHWIARIRINMLKADDYYYALLNELRNKRRINKSESLYKLNYNPYLYRTKLMHEYFDNFSTELKLILSSMLYEDRAIFIQFHNIMMTLEKSFIYAARHARSKYQTLAKLGSLNYLFVSLYFLMRYINLHHFATLITIWMHRRGTIKHFIAFNLYLNVLKIFWVVFKDFNYLTSCKFLAGGTIGRHGRAKQFKFIIGRLKISNYDRFVDYHMSTINTKFGSLGFKFWAYSKLDLRTTTHKPIKINKYITFVSLFVIDSYQAYSSFSSPPF